MTAKLVAEEGLLKGLVLSLDEGDHWIIGRDPDTCQLIVEDPSTSRKHLVCQKTPQGILIENLSSTNPILVNEEVITEPRLLQQGDAVKIGASIFRFYAEAAAHLFEDIEEEVVKNEKMPVNHVERYPNIPTPEIDPTAHPIESTDLPPHPKEEIAKNHLPDSEDEPFEYEDEGEARHDTIFREEGEDGKVKLANINFNLIDTRWLLKVIGGPNNGAEFPLQPNNSYIIGSDPNTSDIVFYDSSVSRQHARITITPEETISIEDLKSRNGTRVDGEMLQGSRSLSTNTLVTIGTSSFVIYDREAEMQTIISPLLPSIVKVLQHDEEMKSKKEPEIGSSKSPSAEDKQKEEQEISPMPTQAPSAASKKEPKRSWLLPAVVLGLIILLGLGTQTLFKSEPIIVQQAVNLDQILADGLKPYPGVKYSFNKNTGRLLLVGHVLTPSDKTQLLYTLRGMTFLKDIDDSGVIIDQYVWSEINQVLAGTPSWRTISVNSPTPGYFVISGYLHTRQDAEHVWDYMMANFSYSNLLENKIVVEEDVVTAVLSQLHSIGLGGITVQMKNGELSLSGNYLRGKKAEYSALLEKFKKIPGVRIVSNYALELGPEASLINVSDKYRVSGFSRQDGGNLSVVIQGRILSKGDYLDGMTITEIKPHIILLEKDQVKYQIDY